MKATDNLLAWQAFITTCRTGSISATAMALDLDICKVSRLLSELEHALGFALFDKRHRPMTTTAKGTVVLARVQPVVEGLYTAIGEIVGDIESVQGPITIRFSAPPELMQEYFTDFLLQYSQEHPNISFSMHPALSPEAMLTSDIDVAVSNTPANPKGLIVRPYSTTIGRPLATPEYLRRNGRPHEPEDLIDHVGLLQESPLERPSQHLYRDGRQSGALVWKRVFKSHDQLTIKRMVLEHQGIAVDLFPGHVLDEITSGRLVPVLDGWHRCAWNMCVLTRVEDENRSPALKAFAEWFTRVASAHKLELNETIWRALHAAAIAQPH